MSVEETNVAILKEGYAVWHGSKGADTSFWMNTLADTISWGSLANGKPGMDFTKPRASKEEVVEYFEGLANDWQMEFYHINEYVAQGDRVVAIAEISFNHKGTGKNITIPKVDIFKFKDGKITEFMEHYDTYEALGATQPD